MTLLPAAALVVGAHDGAEETGAEGDDHEMPGEVGGPEVNPARS